MKNEPKIRIKGFEGEWKEYSFNNLFSLVSDYKSNIGNKTDYQEEGKYPIIDQSKEYIVGYTNEDNPIIPDNGIIVFGDHTREIKYIDFPFYTGADGTKLLHCQESVFPLFGYYSCCSQRIPNTGYNRHYKFLKEADYIIPSLTEQRAIATYFRHIDSLMESADKKVASLKQVKEASLQSMFPKEGQKVPEVRFKGFEGEWKIDKLGNLFTERVESDVFAEMLSVTQSQGIIKANENGRYDNSNNDKSKYRLVKVGDIAYNSMRMWQGASGYSPYYGIVSPAYTVVVPNNNVDSCFFAYMFKTAIMIKQFRLHSQGLTTDTWNLKFPAFSKIDVTYPDDTAEQRKIASFFVHLDKQIAIAQQRLDLLRRIKSACLDEMFV